MGCEVGEWGEWVHSLKLHPRYAWTICLPKSTFFCFFQALIRLYNLYIKANATDVVVHVVLHCNSEES